MSRPVETVLRVRARARPVLFFSLAFAGVWAVAVVPLASLLLRLFLLRWGRVSIGNFEIASFALSAEGIVGGLVIGSVGLAGVYLHLAGLLEVLGEPGRNALGAFRGFFGHGHRLLTLALWQVGVLLAVALPCALAALGVAGWAFRGQDLNALLALKPPAFWYGAVGAAVPILLLAGLVLALLVRWLFAVPALLLDPDLSPRAALRRSAELTRGRRWCLLRALAGYLGAILLVGLAALWALRLGAGALLDAIGSSRRAAVPAMGGVLLVATAVAALLAWYGAAVIASLVWTLHRDATGGREGPASPAAEPPVRIRRAWLVPAAIVAATALVGGAAHGLLGDVELHDAVEITAHRAGAVRGPENTVAALRRAIEDGADWAEIDVQQAKDGAVVVLHDSDLARIGGGATKVADATLEEIRALDVGRALGRDPPGERVPTFEEFLAAAGDRIRLNVELKPPAPEAAEPLVNAVLAAMRTAGMVARCRICSQSYDAIRLAKRFEPGIQIGFIAGAALGDLSRLEVDYLMVNRSLATPRLVENAHARGIEVHPWTINDPDDLLPLIDNGVDNVITDAPGAFRARLAEVRAMPIGERLLMRARDLLAE